MDTSLEEIVMRACKNEIDYSSRFEDKIIYIQKSAEEYFETVIDIDNDMNYSASKKLIFYMDKTSKMLENSTNFTSENRWQNADHIVEVLISSLGNFYWSRIIGKKKILGITLRKNATRTERFYSSVLQNKTRIDEFIERLGFQNIPDPLLWKTVPEIKTHLEGKPATVFDIIFSEI
ncbi:MAG: hypothetical protein BalsKO_29780 [Balneolaceae bacterium]